MHLRSHFLPFSRELCFSNVPLFNHKQAGLLGAVTEVSALGAVVQVFQVRKNRCSFLRLMKLAGAGPSRSENEEEN